MTITPLASTGNSRRYSVRTAQGLAFIVGPVTGHGGMAVVTSALGSVYGVPLQAGEFFGLAWVERHFSEVAAA